MYIGSFFADEGIPRLGLTPTIRIWEVTETSETLTINGAALTEVGDGFYKYNFTTYDSTKDYMFRVDGGSVLTDTDRYHYGSTGYAKLEQQTIDQISDGVWDETASDHLGGGSTGEALATIKSDTSSTAISVISLNTLVTTLLKYEKNRTVIDKTSMTLTIYDDDCTTPLHVFYLKDSNGNLSVTEVCERVPTTCP